MVRLESTALSSAEITEALRSQLSYSPDVLFIQRKLQVAEGIYEVVTDQANHFRSQFLEFIVIILILFEVIMGFVHR
jgi:uncharacterized Rmd1/YagE family protein